MRGRSCCKASSMEDDSPASVASLVRRTHRGEHSRISLAQRQVVVNHHGPGRFVRCPDQGDALRLEQAAQPLRRETTCFRHDIAPLLRLAHPWKS